MAKWCSPQRPGAPDVAFVAEGFPSATALPRLGVTPGFAAVRRNITSVVSGIGELSLQLQRMGNLSRDPQAVTTFLQTHAVDQASLEPYIQFQPGSYTRNSVYRDEAFELLVLCWATGSRSPIHDHGGNRCWLLPQSGAFFVDDYVRIEGGRRPGPVLLEQSDATCLRSGDFDVRGLDDVNDIHAIHVERPSISVHVYAAPIGSYHVFDRDRRSCDVRGFSALDVFDFVI